MKKTMMNIMMKMMNCEKTGKLISKKFDRKLNFLEYLSLKFHQMMCSACTLFEVESDIISETLKKSDDTPCVMCPDKKSALQEALRANK